MYQNQWLVIGVSGATCSGKTTLATALYNYFINNKNRILFNSNIIIEDAVIINQDNYFLPKNDPRHQWIKKLNHINWEIMSSLDMDKMIDDIRNLLTDQFVLYNKNMMTIINNETIIETIELNNDNNFSYNDGNIINNISNNCCNNSNNKLFNNISTQTYTSGTSSITGAAAAAATAAAATTATTETTSVLSSYNEAKKIKILIIEGFLIFNHPQLLQLCQIKFHLHLPYEKCYERRIKRVYDPPDVIGYFEMCVWPMYEKHFNDYKDCGDIYILNGETPKEKLFKYVLNCISNYL